jgi:hypothetical protein
VAKPPHFHLLSLESNNRVKITFYQYVVSDNPCGGRDGVKGVLEAEITRDRLTLQGKDSATRFVAAAFLLRTKR